MLGTTVLALTATALAAASPSGRLPVVQIEPQRAIVNAPKVDARMRMPGYSGRIGIEVRGQSSQDLFAKRSYAVELRDAAGRDRKRPLLGMPADGDWVLYAAYNDKTLIRNVVAYRIARAMGRWAAQTRFVELVIDGRYEGVYVLMERPELGEARVDVPGRGVTGDYLLEFTFPFQAQRKGAPYFRTPLRRRPIIYEDPDRSDLTAREARYVRGYVRRVERVLYSRRRGAWRTVLDPAAAVDYVLMQELFRNEDAFHGSTFLTKPAGGRLVLGPVWDFDLSTGNSTGGSRSTRGWWTTGRDWAQALHRDPTFRRAMRARWRELRAGGIRRLVRSAVSRNAAAVRPAARRNFERWPVLWVRVWPNPVARGSFDAEVRFLRSWLTRRIAWLDRASRPRP